MKVYGLKFGEEVESTLCVPGRQLRGSVGQGVRPSQAAARGVGDSRSVGSPESGSRGVASAQWSRGSVGRAPLLAAERARRVSRSENTHLNTSAHKTLEKRSDFILHATGWPESRRCTRRL